MMVSDQGRLLCVPVGAWRANELSSAASRAAQVADIIELRLDYLSEAELEEVTPSFLQTLIASLARPLIITLRPAEQGGRGELSFPQRLQFWRRMFEHTQPTGLFVDLEFELLSHVRQHEKELYDSLVQEQVICSYHDFAGTSLNLNDLYGRMKNVPARVLKIAVRVDDAVGCVPVFQLLERARGEGREMISIAMGEAGVATRILAPSRGGFLTYGALDAEHITAPGQISARALRDLYRVHNINRETVITGLVGAPVAHSVSPQIHNEAFIHKGINAVYVPFEVKVLSEFITRMARPRTREIDWNLRGFSVTAPHKTEIIQHLDWVDPTAREVGSINTVVVEGDALHGYNTDTAAAINPLQEITELRGCHAAVIGAGGAARSLVWGLRKAGVGVTVFARNSARAAKLASEFDVSHAPLEAARFNEFDVVINATTLGTRGGSSEQKTPATAEQLRGARIAYDLVYNPVQTSFTRAAAQAGCETINGLAMLVGQAVEQFELWTGEDAPRDVMRRAAVKACS